ncbi:MAG TPA: TIGR02281 family clan AA aspartic protease [Burkholderiales bacterium]|jgi:aspartyl protease family protein|nr:TIGR02281 family clan AA aspartic protease [Burkholderiales bacterium]
MMRHFPLLAAVAAFTALPLTAAAVDINVVGLTSGKAIVVIGNAPPRLMRAGDTGPDDVRLLSASSDSAVFEIGGKRETLTLGQRAAVGSAVGPAASGGQPSVTLTADNGGHFIANGSVNGISIRFLVDTGATSVALSAADAKRAGVDYLAGQHAYSSTANGVVAVYHVRLDSVTVGNITLHNVDAVVFDGHKLPIALLGMSFLNRMEMKRDGTTMTLVKRY